MYLNSVTLRCYQENWFQRQKGRENGLLTQEYHDKSMLPNTTSWAKSLKGMPAQTHSWLAVPVQPQKSPAIWTAMSSKVMVALPTPGRNMLSPSDDKVHVQLSPSYEAGIALPLWDWRNQLPTSNKPARSLGQLRTADACRLAKSQ